MSTDLLRQAAGRLEIRCLTVRSDAHPNPVEVEKWRGEWKRLAAWLRTVAVAADLTGAPIGDEVLAVASAVLGRDA